MDTRELFNAFDVVLDLGDSLDNAGGGAKALTDGKLTTRKACRVELGRFLMYIADGGSNISDKQAMLINLVMNNETSPFSPNELHELFSNIDAPNPSESLTFDAFRQGDMVLPLQNANWSTEMTNMLVCLYDNFGKLIVALNKSDAAQSRYDRLMAELKSELSLTGIIPIKDEYDPEIEEEHGSETKAASKPAGSNTVVREELAKYNERVSFALFNNYHMIWDKDDDGNDSCRIVLNNASDDEDVDQSLSCYISVISNDESDDELLDVLEANDQDPSTKIRFHSDPDALLTITYINMQILSVNCRTTVYNLFIRLSHSEMLLLSLTRAAFGEENTLKEDIPILLDLWRTIRIDGKPVDMGEARTTQSLFTYLNQLPESSGESSQESNTSSLSVAPVLSGRIIRFGESVILKMKDNYQAENAVAPNGKAYIEVECGEYHGAVGYMDAMDMRTYKINPGETGIEAVHRMGWDHGGWIRWSDSPDAEVHMRTDRRANMKLFSICLYLQTDENPDPIQVSVNSGWYDDDMDWNQRAYDSLIEMISMIKVNGNPLPDHGLSGKKLMSLLKPRYDGKDVGRIILPDEKSVSKKDYTVTARNKKARTNNVSVLGKNVNRDMNMLSEDISDKKLKDYLSRDEIIFMGSLFTFYGVSVEEGDSLALRLEMAGGYLRLDVSSKTNYLVVKNLKCKETTKLKKAKEYINKGHDLKIVLLEDFEKALNAAGYTEDAYKAKRQKEEEDIRQQVKELKDGNEKGTILNFGGETIIYSEHTSQVSQGSLRRIVIPEGVIKIMSLAFSNTQITEVVFPSTLKKIYNHAFYNCENLINIELNEGIEEIDERAFYKCPKLLYVHLPDSLKVLKHTAFEMFCNRAEHWQSYVTLEMSGRLARYLYEHNPNSKPPVVEARNFIIDGKDYATIEDYIEDYKKQEQLRREAEEKARQEKLRQEAEEKLLKEAEEKKRQEKLRHEAAERERQEQERRERERRKREEAEIKAIEARKAAERERINEEIFDLTNEIESLRGLFAGVKRKKLQKRINELREQLRSI